MSTDFERTLEKYAELALKVGLNSAIRATVVHPRADSDRAAGQTDYCARVPDGRAVR